MRLGEGDKVVTVARTPRSEEDEAIAVQVDAGSPEEE